MTYAERRLWSELRNKKFGGFRFRTLQPAGPYIADFFCAEAKLIIEVDGGQHGTDEGLEKDERRTSWLQSRGYAAMRFWNGEVLAELKAVPGCIDARLAAIGVPYKEDRE